MTSHQSMLAPSRNRVLAALAPAEAVQVLSQLEPVRLQHGQVLSTAGTPVTHVYFPLTTLVSLLVVLEDGPPVAIAAVGRESMVGLLLALGSTTAGHGAVVEHPGVALRMELDAFHTAQTSLPGLHRLLDHAAGRLLTHMAQAAACNRLHRLRARSARWLLEVQDRVEADEFTLTQDLLAAVLNVPRTSVTVAAGMLNRAGLITYRSGRVTVHNRAGLVSIACACYHSSIPVTDAACSSSTRV